METLKIEVEFDGEMYIAEVIIYWHWDTYGEDADGNRGVQVKKVDHVVVDYVEGENGFPLALAPKGLEEVIEREAVTQFMED